MAYKKKSEWEKEFVKEVLSVGGVKVCGCMSEGRNFYWYFDLANGTRRYWTNLSEENQKILGVYEESENHYDGNVICTLK